jgi:hypothetical protein
MKNAVAIGSVEIVVCAVLVNASSGRQVLTHVAPDGDDSRGAISRESAVGSLDAARQRVRVVKHAGDFGSTRLVGDESWRPSRTMRPIRERSFR